MQPNAQSTASGRSVSPETDLNEVEAANFVRSTFKHQLTTSTAAQPLQPEKDPLTLSQWSPDQTGSTAMLAMGGRDTYAAPATTSPIPSPAKQEPAKPTASNASSRPSAPGFGKASEWENKILIDDVTEVSRMTGLVPGSREISSMLPRKGNEDDDSSVFDQIQSQPRTNEGDLLRRQERRTGKPATPTKHHPSDYDPSELDALRTGKADQDSKKKGGGLFGKLVAFVGIVGVVAVMVVVGFSYLGKQGAGERPATFTTPGGVSVRNLSGHWAINLMIALENGAFQTFETDIEQNMLTLSGSGRDADGSFSISGEISDDGKRITVKKLYEGQSRFHLPIFMTGEVSQGAPAIGGGHFYAHIDDQNGRTRVTGQWQAQLAPSQPKSVF